MLPPVATPETIKNSGKSASVDRPLSSRAGFTLWIAASFLLLALGGVLTSIGLSDRAWYDQLDFPPYQPPAWVFSPTWIVILTLLAIATHRLSPSRQAPTTSSKTGTTSNLFMGAAYLLYGMQFVLNVGWSLLFFTLRRPDAALWNIVVLDVVLLAMIVAYGRIDRPAGLMLLPYLLWLLYATAINAWIALHNGPFG
ncbi:MAG: TspO/MBR family protein [Planctomycetota bacterium]